MEDSLVSMTLKTYLYMFEIVISYKELLKLQWILSIYHSLSLEFCFS